MATIVLYPSPGMGHLISMVELGKLIIKHHPSFNVVVLALIPSFNTGTTASYVRHISATFPAITFHILPDIPLDPLLYPSMEGIIFDLIRRSTPNVSLALGSITQSCNVVACVIDIFCTPAKTVAGNFGVPVYYFYTSGAYCLAQALYLPTLHAITTESFKDMNTVITTPGVPPLHSTDMSDTVLDRSSTDYSTLIEFSEHLPKSAGIIVNSFESLESKAIKAITDGLCVPDGLTPPVYCIGPLVADASEDDGLHECLKWLDSQPSESVVYLCFGSLGVFSSDQLKEIANGLEASGHRFLWVVRSPPTNKTERFLPLPEPDLDALLPHGFLTRTEERGLVVKKWAPQVAVLNHKSIGGFVTHCGWNSVLEAIGAGVPMIAWPLYAEQRFNKALLVNEMKLALPMDKSDDGMVTAAEIKTRVRQLMESEEGEVVRKMAITRKNEAVLAMSDDGSSRVALAELVNVEYFITK